LKISTPMPISIDLGLCAFLDPFSDVSSTDEEDQPR
jgi:hypothetical protein